MYIFSWFQHLSWGLFLVKTVHVGWYVEIRWEVFLPPGGRVGPMRWPCILGFWRAPLPAGILALPAWLSWRLRWDTKKRSVQRLWVKRGIGRGTFRFPFTKVSLRTPKKDKDLPGSPRFFDKTLFCIYPHNASNSDHQDDITYWKKAFIRKPGILGTPKKPRFFSCLGWNLGRGEAPWRGQQIAHPSQGGFRFQPYISYTRLQGWGKKQSQDFRQM